MRRWNTIAVFAFSVSFFTSLALAGDSGIRSGFVDAADEVRIHYLEAGTAGRDPALLFVPGWTMPAWIWDSQIKYFSDKRRVVAMDPRSQGESSQTTEGHHPAARARDIKAVIDKLKLAPAVLVGWSMGVPEVISFIDQFGTDSLAAVVLVDGIAGADFDPNMGPFMLRFAASFQKDRRKATEAFVRSMYKKAQAQEYLQRVTAASLLTPTNSAIALFVGAFTTDLRATLEKIDRPALIVVAGNESNPWMARYRDMQRRIPGARLEIFTDAGHALFVDEAERFNLLLEDFLKTSAASPRSQR